MHVLIISYAISWLFPTEILIGNTPSFSVFGYEIYRLFLSPLAGDSLVNLVFVAFSFPSMGSRIEMCVGSCAYLFLIVIVSLITNVAFAVVCIILHHCTIPDALFYRSSGFWLVLFGLITVECSQVVSNVNESHSPQSRTVLSICNFMIFNRVMSYPSNDRRLRRIPHFVQILLGSLHAGTKPTTKDDADPCRHSWQALSHTHVWHFLLVRGPETQLRSLDLCGLSVPEGISRLHKAQFLFSQQSGVTNGYDALPES
jgi:hypothetical protein